MTTTIKATSDGLSGELQVNGAPALRYGADTSGQMPGFRNKIINGKMEIAQRGTSFAAIAANVYSLDRWRTNTYTTSAVFTVSQQADVPANNEFQSSLRFAVTTADTSIAAGDQVAIIQTIEGYNVRDLIGRTFALSFWVRSSKTGVHCISFRSSNSDRSYIAEYTINSANTWEYKTIAVSGGLITAGTWDWTNGVGLNVAFTLAVGSTLQTTPGAWQTGNFLATANQVNCLDTVGNIFAITGVQLEVGSIATPFEHRPYGTELALCQRYYQACVIGTSEYGPVGYAFGYAAAAANWAQTFSFNTSMRATPTMTKVGTWTVVNASQPTLSAQSSGSFRVLTTATATGALSAIATTSGLGWTAEAEL